MTHEIKQYPDADERLAALSPAKRALLEKLLEKQRRAISVPQEIGPRPQGKAAPLSHGQKRLWFLDQLEGASATYQMGGALRLEGALDPSALGRALVEIVRRHEVLRSRVMNQRGDAVPVVSPEICCPLPVISLESVASERREEEVGRLATEHLRRPFDLARDTLLRTTLLRVEPRLHVLLLAVHHIMSDGWSIGVFFRELSTLYAAYTRGDACELPDLPIQYADYAYWQQQNLTREALVPLLEVWRDRLRGAPPVLDLPFDRPRPPVQTFRGQTYRFSIDAALERRVARLARETGTTLFMVLLGAFGVVLSRYASQEDLVIGSPVANRPRKELESLIGFFVNTLPLRIDLAGRPTVRELMARVRAMCLGAYAHQDVPFELLVEELRPERNLSHSPLFQVMFALQNAQVDAAEIGDLKVSTFDPDTGTSMFDWTLFVQETKNGLAAAVEYNTDLFDESTVVRFAGHFRTVLAELTSHPERRVSEISLFDESERSRYLVGWNATAVRHEGPATVPLMFAAAVKEHRDRTAVRFEEESWTYAVLHERVAGMAAYLRTLGLSTGDRVAIFLDRSPDMLVALLGALAAGGVYVPLDPAFPRDRLAFMLADSGAAIVITETNLLAQVPPSSTKLVVVDRDRDDIARAVCERWIAPGPGDGAYIIYTSGSTGQPKGVAIAHGALAQFLTAMGREPGMGRDDLLLAVTTISFDIAGLELYLPLSVGAAVEIASREVASDALRLRAALECSRATVIQATPATYWALLEAGLSRCSLRKILCGGEALPRELARRLAKLGAEVWNLYGPTETTIWSSVYRVPSDVGEGPGPDFCPIGRPIANTQMYLLDRYGHPAPIGVTGELLIGGAGVAMRYLNRPGLTAERFVPDPFGGCPGERLYRTGDLARYRQEGTIEFVGRVDHQIKLRGYRIEIGEIEATLNQHPTVQASAVVCRDGALEKKELIAYFVASADRDDAAFDGLALDAQRASEWQKIWDDTYGEDRQADALLDIAGWKSSYTGEAIAAAEMQRWADQTAARILRLRPRRVLDVGCGTGLILQRLLPHVESYLGTDASSVVLDQLGARVTPADASRVRLACTTAAELGKLGEREFDVIILNSVVQYFPSLAYLDDVLEQAIALLAPGGAVFVGDVRSRLHLDLQHAAVQFFRAKPSETRADVRDAAQRSLAREQELVIHPRAFAQIGERLGLAPVAIDLKRGRDANEMTQFRYDVVLRAAPEGANGAPKIEPEAVCVVDAKDLAGRPLDEIGLLLRRNQESAAFIVADLPSERVAGAMRIARWLDGEEGPNTVGELRALAAEASAGVDPEDVWVLGESLGYAVDVTWAANDPRGRFDVLFRRNRAKSGHPLPPGWPRWPAEDGDRLASDPLAVRRDRAIVERVRRHLEERLPAYMVPAQWVRLDAFPLTPNGKVDRRALRPPDHFRRAEIEIEPRSDPEKRLAAIWAEALRLDRVGVTVDFFEIGGHSLLATQIVSRIRDAFQIELPLRSLFEARTIEALARDLATRQRDATPLLAPILAARGEGAAPLSFSQQRLWFLDRLEGPSATYNLFGSLRLRGKLDANALERALQAIAERHTVLRARFVEIDGKALQVVSSDPPPSLEIERMVGESIADRERQGRAFATQVAHRPFDLESGPLFRASLALLDTEDSLLIVALHHIVADEWSIRILLRELSESYEAFTSGNPPSSPALVIQYADYAAWQREWLAGQVREAQLAFWRGHLAGAPRSLSLRTDRPRPPVQTFRGRTRSFEVGRALSARLGELARSHRATLFQTLLAAFAVLLSRHTGERDVVVGTPIANRTRLEFEPLIGFFVNTLALRIDLRDDPTVLALIDRVRGVCFDAQEHQDVPFESIVEDLKVPRDLSRAPLFQVMFVLQNTPLSELSLGQIDVSDFPIESSTARFDLTLSIEDAEGVLRGAFEYNSDLFDDVTISALTEHWLLLLDAIVTHGDARVSQLRVIDEDERERLLALASEPRVEAADDLTVADLFALQARRAPDSVAVVSVAATLTYGELATRVTKLATRLAEEGVDGDVIVGLYLDDPVEQLVALLSILQAGGAYLPLDTGYPAGRIAFMLADSRASFVVTTSRLAVEIADSTCRAICLDGEARQKGARSAVGSADERRRLGSKAKAGPDQFAYVVYTSGSTGQPKGIGVTHRAIVRLARAQRHLYGIDASSRILQFVSVSFDVAASDVVMALTCGASLHLLSPESRTPGPLLLDRLEDQRITHLQVPASILASLPWRALPDLRAVIVGGESSPRGVLERWQQGRRVFNAYGPTETTVAATAGEILGDDVTVHIGRPIAGARVYILDGQLEPAPFGVAGEIYVGGDQLARGYVERPALTAERFLPDPYAPAPGGRMYRTGDLARYRSDGRIEFLGRSDHQIKLHGNRIELGEIEATLASHPLVEKCVVLLREPKSGQPRLAAFVALREGAAASADDLRRFLQDRLPLPLVPGAFAILPALPLTMNGKIDRDALSAFDGQEGGTYVAPRVAAESTLAEIWKELLGAQQVSVFDNFFALGGDSIVSIQVVSRARQAGLDLSVKQLFQHQTVAELAAVARPTLTRRTPEVAVSGPVPLTPVQQWFFEGVTGNVHYFNQSMFIRARAKLDTAVLQDALDCVVRQHDMLRARFRSDGGFWTQELAEGDHHIALAVEDVGTAGSVVDVRSAIEASAAGWQASLHLTEGPIGRAILYRATGSEPDRLLLVLHHLVVDGVSWRVLIEDLERAYVQRARGAEVDLGPKTTSFPAWSERLRTHVLSESVADELRYWLEIADTDGVLPRDFPRSREPLVTGGTSTFTKRLDAQVTRQLLVETPAAYRTQINDVLLAALARSVDSVFGVPRLRIDLEGHGREELFADVDLSRTVGWLTTIFPVILAAAPGDGVAHSLCSSKEMLRRVPQHGINYGILRYLGSDPVRERLTQVAPADLSFNYLGRFDHDGASSLFDGEVDESPGPPWGQGERRRYVLEVNSWISRGQLHIALTYSSDAHKSATIERLAEALATELAAIAKHCASPNSGGYTPSDFPLGRLDGPALDRLLQRFGRGVEDVYPLSAVQQGMLFHNSYEPTSGAYCQQLVARLSGDVRPDVLMRAFAAVIERHPALRTAFVEETDASLQVVLSQVTVPWEHQDLRDLPLSEGRRAFEDFLVNDRQRGFDLTKAPLMRFALVRLDGGHHLVFTHHHLLLDGWSLSIVLGEVRRAYESFLRGGAFELPRPRPFRDYVAWLETRDASSIAYWRETLAGLRAPTRLGIEKWQGTAAPLPAFGERQRRVSSRLTGALRDMARLSRVTIGVVVQAAWSVLLARYSGDRDVVFGATVAGRPSAIAEVESMVGLFIATIPVRESPSPHLPVFEYLAGLQARQLAREPHVHTPLVEIKACSELPASSPLFETLVVFENYPAGALSLQDPAAMTIDDVRAIERTNYPLTLFVSPGDTLDLAISYDSARYDDVRMERVLEHLENLLVAMTENHEAPLARLSMLSSEERNATQERANETERPPSSEGLVHDAIAAQAARTPDAIAVACGSEKLTYRELMRRVETLAVRLGGLGVGREVIVALYLDRSVELVVALLAVLRAGGTYLPLDTEFPSERIGFMLRDSGARWVLTQADLASSLSPSEAGILCLDVSGGPAPFVEPVARPVVADHAAYVIYTSGSTGRPKGVSISHGSLRNFLLSMAREPGICCDDVLLSVTTISFDIAGLELLLPLSVGARVEILPSGQSRDARQIVAALVASSANMMQATPTTWRMLLEESWSGVRLERALSGGEALPRALADALIERGVELWNLYGPTETTIWSSCQRIERTCVEAADATCSIGRPIANTRMYVLSADLDLVPTGVVGELFIGGDGVARGYLRRPSLTAERFVPDPFSPRPGARMYRTGDRVRYGEGGALEFMGRVDHQIKLRGHRIELGEIEAVLAQHPRVANAAVVPRGTGADLELVAYLVERDGLRGGGPPPVSPRDLRAWLGERLPSSMSVAVYVWMASLPLTLNGKIDRARLPMAARERDVVGKVAPRTATEVRLTQIWKDVLGASELGIEDDFFLVGGHSLRATRVVAQIRAVFEVTLPLAYFFEHPTVRELAAAIDRKVCGSAAPNDEVREGEEEFTL